MYKFYSLTKQACAALLFTVISGPFVPSNLKAQEGPPPDFQGPPPGGPMQPENAKKQLARMTHRYSLTATQQESIKPLLEEERQKITQLMQDANSEPGNKFEQMRTIHQESNTKIEALLTDDQRAKFEQDEAKRAARMQNGPPPPPDGGEGGPPN